MFRPFASTADRSHPCAASFERRLAPEGLSASRLRSSPKGGDAELTSPQRWMVVLAIGLLHLGAAGWLLRPAMNPTSMPSRETTLQVDWIAVAEPIVSSAAVPAAAPSPVPVRSARRSPAVTEALLSAAAESPSPVSLAPPAVPVAHAAADDAPIRPIDAPATTPTASSVAVANTDTAVAAPVWPALPNNLPAESVQYLVPPAPVYPRLSRRQGETGRVLVRVYIDEAGLPRSVQLSASSGHGRLDDAALQAVQQARFKPYAENGRPTGGWAFIPLTFDLEKSP
jgi:protein TonB